jgi:multiple sugar transport system permease protein
VTSTKTGPSNVLSGLSRARKGIGLGGRSEHPPRPPRRLSSRIITLALLVFPSVFLVVLIYGYPAIYAVIESLHNGNLVQTGPYVALHNFWIDFHNPVFWHSVRFTVVYCVVGVFGSWIVGLGLALLLRKRMHARSFFKTLLLLPWVVPVVVTATGWNYLVATPSSPVPRIAQDLGFGQLLFLDSPGLAEFIVCVYKIWLSFPFMMLMASAALAGVEEHLYEAARVDGAGAWQLFRRITLPLIARSTYISWILMFIFCIGDFQSIYLLTGGGPVSSTSTLVVLSYETVFGDFQTGPGVAIGIIMLLISVLVSVILFRRIKKVQIS